MQYSIKNYYKALKFLGRNAEFTPLDLMLLLQYKSGLPKEKLITENYGFQLSLFKYLFYLLDLLFLRFSFPIHYIIRKKEFYSHEFFIEKGILIPRPDSETLVEAVIEKIKILVSRGETEVSVAEIGTGSGALILSVMKYFNDLNFPVKFKFYGVDRSEIALRTTKKNYFYLFQNPGNHNGLKKYRSVKSTMKRPDKENNFLFILFRSDLLNCFLSKKRNKKPYFSNGVKGDNCSGNAEGKPGFDLIFSNPFYISPRDFKKCERKIRWYEPKKALIAKKNGDYFYLKILGQSFDMLRHGGYLIFETGDDAQACRVEQYMKEKSFGIEKIKDLTGISRVVAGRKR